MEVLQLVTQLWTALWTFKDMYDQHVESKKEIQELQSFIQDYDRQVPLLRERFQKGGGNVMGVAALKNLEKDVRETISELERWSRDKSFFRLFNFAERMQRLEKLHGKVMSSVQKSLGFASLSLLLDVQATQATILESNVELKSLLINSIRSTHGSLPAGVRAEVVEASTSAFGDPKFWEDILAAVDNHNERVSSVEENDKFDDPITAELMIDPVVASDGNTYCRWTIIDRHLTRNPVNVDEDLTILVDNLSLRRDLFEKFPKQAQVFRQRRDEYRRHALSLKAKGFWGDALLALQYVRQWNGRDVECVEALAQVQRALQAARGKYLGPSVAPSEKLDNAGPSESRMRENVVGDSIEQQEASKLLPLLSSSSREVQQRALVSVCRRSKRDSTFQRYIAKNGGVHLLSALLPSSDHSTQETIVSVLLDVCLISHKRRTLFGAADSDFSGALEPIAGVLKDSSARARELAARIFFHLSKDSGERYSVVRREPEPGNRFIDVWCPPVVMRALVSSLGDGALQVQQIVSSTLHNFFRDASVERRALEAGLVPTLSRLIVGQVSAVLEEALPLLNDVLNFKVDCRNEIRSGVLPSVWVDIIKSSTSMNDRRAASILYSLCCNDADYREQVNSRDLPKCKVRYCKTFRDLRDLLVSAVPKKSCPARIYFPKKADWWSPRRA